MTTSQLQLFLDDVLTRVKTEEDFAIIEQCTYDLSKLVENGIVKIDQIKSAILKLPVQFIKSTLQGFIIQKPFGYAGDFMTIDKLYQQSISSNPKYAIWDKFLHTCSSATAVRNRKDYFHQIMLPKIAQGKLISLLDLASGPARDLKELYEQMDKPSQLQTTCLDMDAHAIEYASNLNKPYLNQIKFINQNIFRFQPTEQYDVVWSAGLFDYFEDKVFVKLLKRLKAAIKPGGELIIGNFNEDHNPHRNYMELFGDWYLHHRTTQQLFDLATEAGFDQSMIEVGQEKQGVNLFLHTRV